MTAEMRKLLARLPYAEKLRRVAELIEFSRKFKAPRRAEIRGVGSEQASTENGSEVYARPAPLNRIRL